jgi:glucose/arabinose dehydrogenase
MRDPNTSSGARRRLPAAVAIAALVLAATSILGTQARAGAGIRAVSVGEFDSPVYVENAPGAPNLLFVVEQGGAIEVLRGGRTRERPFLDLTDAVRSGGEEGLLSVAFAPDYERSRRFYVYFTNNDGDIEINEFKASRRSPTRANRHSRRRLLIVPHPGESNHNGGTLAFGRDGKLYIGTGDGGGADDSHDNARDLGSLLGKLLRIDPREGKRRPYGIPNDNPYVGRSGRDEIWSYGLRNPYRWSFDRRVIAVADVGQGAVEEVNMGRLAATKGANFGWPQYEGNEPHDPDRPGADPPRFPIYTYPLDGGACAVIGGFVVRDRGLPSLRGRYIFGDHCEGEIFGFVPNLEANRAEDVAPIGIHVPSLSGISEGARSAVYVISLDGGVWRLEQ